MWHGHFQRMEVLIGGSVEDLAQAVKTRAMGGAVPRLFRVIPCHNGAEMRTHGGTFVKGPVRVAIYSDLGESMPYDCSRAGWNETILIDVAGRQPIGILRDHVGGFFGELVRGAERNARWTVEFRPRVLATFNEVREQQTGDGAMGQAAAGVARHDEHVIMIQRISASKDPRSLLRGSLLAEYLNLATRCGQWPYPD